VLHLITAASASSPAPASPEGSIVLLLLGAAIAVFAVITVIRTAVSVVTRLVEVATTVGTTVMTATFVGAVLLGVYLIQTVRSHLPG